MSSNALLNRAAHVISSASKGLAVDSVLRKTLGHRSDLSSEEKGRVSEMVFAYYRWIRWLEKANSLQAALTQALHLQKTFSQFPEQIKDEALAARAVPTWLKDEMTLTPEYLRQLQKTPTLWIRSREKFKITLPEKLRNCVPANMNTPGLPEISALQTAFAYVGKKDLFRTTEFHQGIFEIQDLSSQLVGHACAPLPGETWWDACAGEGGKTLHLADLMQNKGLIWASDRNIRRLGVLRRRAGRAQVFNYRSAVWNGGSSLPTRTKFDGILLDAPCSGIGTWQRNPHARWTCSPGDIRELSELQFRLIGNVLSALKSGGRLIYAVCTLTRSETTDIVQKVSEHFPFMKPRPIFGSSSQHFLLPQELDSNGMFIASWQKE